jgi:hypothetical protein
MKMVGDLIGLSTNEGGFNLIHGMVPGIKANGAELLWKQLLQPCIKVGPEMATPANAVFPKP